MRLAILFFTGLFILAGAHAAEVDQAAALKTLQHEDSLLIDVRSAEEFADGALLGAINLEHDRIAERIASVAPDKDRPLVLYCRSGRRSSFAQDELQALGYSRVINAGAYDDLLPLLERDE